MTVSMFLLGLPDPSVIPDVPGPGAPLAETARSVYDAVASASVGGVPMHVALLGILATLFGLKIAAGAIGGTRITPAMALQFVLAFGASAAYPFLLRGIWTPVWKTVYAPDSGIAGNITAWGDAVGLLAETADVGGDLRDEIAEIVSLKMAEVCKSPSKSLNRLCEQAAVVAGRLTDGVLTYVMPAVFPTAGAAAAWAGLVASMPALVFRHVIVPIARLTMTAGLYFFYIGIAAFVAFAIAASPLLGPFLMLQTTQDLALRPLRWTLQASLMALAIAGATGPIAQMTAVWTDQTLQNFCDTASGATRRTFRAARDAVRTQICPGAPWPDCGRSVTLDLARARSWPGRKDLREAAQSIIHRHIRGCAVVVALASDAPYRSLAGRDGSDIEAAIDAAAAAFASIPAGAAVGALWKAVVSMLVSGLLFLSSPVAARALLPSAFWDNIDLMLKQKVLAAAGIPVATAQAGATRLVQGVAGAGAAVTTGIGAGAGALGGAVLGGALGGPAGIAIGAAAGGALGGGLGRVAAAPFATARGTAGVASAQPREAGERAGSVVMPRPD